MRLVWVVIPLILIGIIGISDSFAIAPSSPFSADITISQPPNLDETADVTLTFVNDGFYYDTIEQFPATIRLPDGLELVSGELETTNFWQQGDTLEVTVTVRAIQTGNWTIQGFGYGGAADYLYLVIDENSSYIHEGNFPTKYSSQRYGEKGEYTLEEALEIQRQRIESAIAKPIGCGDGTADIDEMCKVEQMVKEEYSSPKKQYESGILYEDIKCNGNLDLLFKFDNSPACVKPETAEKLMERGWGVLDFGNEPNYSEIFEKIKIITDNVTTQSYYDVGDESKYSEILEIIKLIPEGNAFLLKHEFAKPNRNLDEVMVVDIDSISIHVGRGYTGESLKVSVLLDDSTFRVTYSCWTDVSEDLTFESNILEVMEKSSCVEELEKSLRN